MIVSITKRDGRVVPFDPQKIEQAIEKSFMASGSRKGLETARRLAEFVVAAVENDEAIPSVPTVEQVQDAVERILIEQGFVRSAKAYILYRAERSRVREMNTRLMKIFEDICFHGTRDSGGTAADTLRRFGSESARQFYEMFVIDPEYTAAHRGGDIHIHALDHYALTAESAQIDLLKLFDGGFAAGYGKLREPQDILSYTALCRIAIQANQNDQHGSQSIVNFDYGMAPGIKKTYGKRFRGNLARALELTLDVEDAAGRAQAMLGELEAETGKRLGLATDAAFDKALKTKLKTFGDIGKETLDRIAEFARGHAEEETEQAAHQAMEAFVHSLNATSTPAAVNYGLDTSPEGRMAARSLLLAAEEGLGGGETPLYPVQVFRVKEGVSFNPGDPNYDLLRLAVRVGAKHMCVRFAFIDAPFNLQYYRKGDYDTEAAYTGGRTRVMGNVHDKSRETAPRRGSLSATTVNLPRIAVKAKGNLNWFFEELERLLNLVTGQLLERFELLAQKKASDFPFLMGEKVWLDAETLKPDDSIREALKHGTLSVGFAGLAEALTALRGKHHGENAASQNLGLEIVGFIRKFCDEMSEKHRMNFTCFATPAGGMAGRFARLDAERYGKLKGVTDRETYTDSFHIPASCSIKAVDRLTLEAPYHALANGGHISVAEMDGDPAKNLDAFEKLLRHMHDVGIGYGTVKGKS
ncbi:MAG: anaerobic ribonucleoside triphosphate reductase [Clostridiales bacterium]|nr:anaerobic ribonucleoside triphosphate reductase [Clostridiales bacterium]